jgi:hypothetical protein
MTVYRLGIYPAGPSFACLSAASRAGGSVDPLAAAQLALTSALPARSRLLEASKTAAAADDAEPAVSLAAALQGADTVGEKDTAMVGCLQAAPQEVMVWPDGRLPENAVPDSCDTSWVCFSLTVKVPPGTMVDFAVSRICSSWPDVEQDASAPISATVAASKIPEQGAGSSGLGIVFRETVMVRPSGRKVALTRRAWSARHMPVPAQHRRR